MLFLALGAICGFGLITPSVGDQFASIQFYHPNGDRLSGKNDIRNVSEEHPFLPLFLQDAFIVCTVGMWRFYPKTDFLYDAGQNSGFEIGSPYETGEACFDIAADGNNLKLAAMQSYRAVPFILDRNSITLYAEQHNAGESETWLPEMSLIFNPTLPTVKSFSVTGVHDSDPLNPDDANAPVYQVFSEPDGGNGIPTDCITLSGTKGGKRAKLHVQRNMRFGGSDLDLKSLRYFPLNFVELNNLCAAPTESWEVPPTIAVNQAKEEDKFITVIDKRVKYENN